mmetsp:Transcript_131765/g.196340  ORF Transcript_131765/g.196340 Transcript_131765/m.196340 type:complete len:362 (-) Transcript_131765:55-1140(-)
MSSSTAIPVSPDLASSFKSSSGIRYFIIHIENEVLVKAYAHPKGGSLGSDWATIASNANNRAGYILVQVETNKWITITFVPQGTKIRDKMIYAATKATLLNHLGYQHFIDELHANDNSELEFSYYEASLKPVNSLSAHEEARNVVHAEEDAERTFRTQMNATSQGIGGYHSVSMPLDASAKDMIRNLSSGAHNFVELAINDAKNGITGKSASNVSGQFSSNVNKIEPRYYLIKQQGVNAFVYCCPDKSPQRLRMVYSTAKGSVMNEAKALGFQNPKAGEISDPSELTSQYISSLSGASPSGVRSYSTPKTFGGGPSRAGGSQVKAQRQSVIAGAHPVYSLMGSPGSTGRSKKIVLPPPGAY